MEQDDSRRWGEAARFPVLPSPRRWTSDPPDTSLFSTLRLWRAFELWFPNSPSDFIAELPFQRQASRRGLSATAPQALPPEFFQLLSIPHPTPLISALSSRSLLSSQSICPTCSVFSNFFCCVCTRSQSDPNLFFVLAFGIWNPDTRNDEWTEWLLPLFDCNFHESRIILSFVSLKLACQIFP